MCMFWVHDESKAAQTFLMHFVANSRKIIAISGMYFSQLYAASWIYFPVWNKSTI